MSRRVFGQDVSITGVTSTLGELRLGAGQAVTGDAVMRVDMGSSGDRVTPLNLAMTRVLILTSSADITLNSADEPSHAFALYPNKFLRLVNGGGKTITLHTGFTPGGTMLQPGDSVEMYGDGELPDGVWRVEARAVLSGFTSIAAVTAYPDPEEDGVLYILFQDD